MTFDERIKKYDINFNDTEDDIVEYIQKHRKDIMKLSIQKMAKELYIAPNVTAQGFVSGFYFILYCKF